VDVCKTLTRMIHAIALLVELNMVLLLAVLARLVQLALSAFARQSGEETSGYSLSRGLVVFA